MRKAMLTANEVKAALGGLLVAARVPDGAAFTGGAIDSREVRAGDLFFALHGERSDGHDFVSKALAAGAAGAVVARPVDATEDAAQIHVSDPLTALQRLASALVARHRLRVIGVTGSVGKTTAKELIAAVLGRRFNVLKTEANLNTEIGVPLTLLRLTQEHDRAVLELGMYVPGDIALLARICHPQIGVVTNVSPVHLERVGSFGRITAGKAELVEALPSDGLAVLNGDDPRVASMVRRTRARSVLYGCSDQSDVRASEVAGRGLEGFSFVLHAAGQSIRVDSPLPGKHHVYPALAAAAVALEEGLSLDEIVAALSEARLDLRLTAKQGPNGSTIIDDSYNASPPSMTAALELLAETPGRHIAVLGHMRELGAAERDGHRAVGRHTAGRSDVLIVVGPEAADLASSAEQAGHNDVRRLADAEEAVTVLKKELHEGDYCLIKASRAVGLEAVVEALVER